MAKAFPNTGVTIIDSSSDLPAASAALEGVMMFQKDTNELKICDGSAWVSALGSDLRICTIRFNTWTPTNTTGTATNTSGVTAVSGTNTNYHSYSYSSPTLTITHKIPGTYKITVMMSQRHAASYTLSRIINTLGGTSTKSWDTGNTAFCVNYGDDAADSDEDSNFTFTVTATANQTTTFAPYFEFTGTGTTGQHKALCWVMSEFINSNTGV